MKKRLFAFLLVCVICVALTPGARAVGVQDVTIYIDGQLFATDVPVRLIDSTTYVPLRAFSQKMADVSVSWDNGTRTAYVYNSSIYLSVKPNAQYLTVNNRYFYLPGGALIINDSLMVPVREIAKAFGATVEWNGEKNAVYVKKGLGTVVSGEKFYDSSSVYWLSRIIYSESGGEPLAGQIAVGNVVLNRVKSDMYPDTIYDVIFAPNQFGPAVTGAINRTPSEMSVIAAKICLEGYNVAGDSLYFINPSDSSNRWFESNLKLTTVIGNHVFYS